MKKYFIIFLTIFSLFLPSISFGLTDGYPKIINYYLRWDIPDADVANLAKWDVLVIDMENGVYSASQIKKIRQINPNIKIFAYVVAQEITKDPASLPADSLHRKLINGFPEQWYLKDQLGNKISWWSGTWLTNNTLSCPTVYGKQWTSYLAEFVHYNVLSTNLFDGVFYDNLWDNVAWVNGGNMDINADGYLDNYTTIDSQWQDGMRSLINRTRELNGGNRQIMGNGGQFYSYLLNGALLEHFPGTDWSKSMENFYKRESDQLSPKINSINVNTSNTGTINYQQFRFGLVSALLAGGYYSYDFGDQNHGQTWYFDEYSANLGNPKDSPYQDSQGIIHRDFDNGMVLLNPTGSDKTIAFDKYYRKINGTQDRKVNDGSLAKWIYLSANDGIILLNNDKNQVKQYLNNNWYQVYKNSVKVDDKSVSAGFLTNKANTIQADLDKDGQIEYLVAVKNAIQIYNSKQKMVGTFLPFGKSYGQNLSLAIVDYNKDGRFEIVCSKIKRDPKSQVDSVVAIFDLKGKILKSFKALDNSKIGFNVATGDINGDSNVEIVVTADSAGGPLVRIFDLNGKLKGQFFAYDKGYKGGVRVAVGDLTSDGIAEIVTTPVAGGPHVKVFNAKGQLKSEFFAYDKGYKWGIYPSIFDYDNDDVAELLIAR